MELVTDIESIKHPSHPGKWVKQNFCMSQLRRLIDAALSRSIKLLVSLHQTYYPFPCYVVLFSYFRREKKCTLQIWKSP